MLGHIAVVAEHQGTYSESIALLITNTSTGWLLVVKQSALAQAGQ